MSEPIDLTSRVLEEIRDELRGVRREVRANGERLDHHTELLMAHNRELAAHSNQLVLQNGRMELIETTLRDLAEQIVMMTRGLKSAIESRARDDARLDDHERRIRELESS